MTEQNTGGQPSDADYWYALGVKDGRDGCLVELDALQARCDKLEAAARDLLDNAEPKWGDKVVVHRSVIEALRSVVDGGDIHADLRKPEQVVRSRQVIVPNNRSNEDE